MYKEQEIGLQEQVESVMDDICLSIEIAVGFFFKRISIMPI